MIRKKSVTTKKGCYLLPDKNIKENFENFIKNMPGSIYCKDVNGTYLACSDYLVINAGLSSMEDIVGKTDYDLFAKPEADRLRTNDSQVMSMNKAIAAEEKITLPDGKVKYFDVIKAPWKNNDGRTIGIIGNSIDITERKEMEESLKEAKNQADQANELKTDFIRNMQHDIRTPLSGIYGIAFAIKKQAKDKLMREYGEDIETAATELLNFSNSILDFSIISGGSYAIMEKKFDVKKVINDIFVMNRPAARHKKLKLLVKIPKDIPGILMGDDFRIKRILMNLIGNSLKFTQNGSVKLILKEIKTNSDSRAVIIQFIVEDTGIGMPKEKQKIIFEKFARLEQSNKGRYKGAGLGLSIVKEFIFDLDGDIEVVSEDGMGTKIICTIPFKLPLTNEMLKGGDDE